MIKRSSVDANVGGTWTCLLATYSESVVKSSIVIRYEIRPLLAVVFLLPFLLTLFQVLAFDMGGGSRA